MSHYNDFSNSNSNPRDNTTPKRKLSFNRRVTDLNGSITSIQYSAAKTTSSNENSPFIKRKRMPKVESCRSFDLESPQYLNQGLESLKLATNEQSAKNSPMRSTKRSNKLIRHRSGPLTQLNLNKYLNNAQNNNLDDERIGEEEKPITTKSSEKEEKTKDEFDSESESKIDDLEDLLFGDRAARKNEESSNAEHHEIIKHSLEIDATCSNMIGDRSKAHVLPVIPSAKHTDLHCISPETLVDVLNGNFNDQIDEYIIVDSRYPYEYEGGHIHNAMNIFTKDRLFEEMFIKRLRFKCPPSSTNASRSLTTYASTNRLSDFMTEFRKSSRQETSQKRVIIIFHCEFSSERGPGLLRFLRSQDRALNEDCYPYLHYPELYLLEGGYKSFYEHFKNYCDPQMYKPMLHAEHLKDLKHFRAKAKSWEVSRHHIINKFSEKQHGLRKQIRSNLSRVQFNNNDNNNNS